MREAEELARRIIEKPERNTQLSWDEDPLFKDLTVYDGPVPADGSERHDDYIYGDKDDLRRQRKP
jgi:hypothetical protein